MELFWVSRCKTGVEIMNRFSIGFDNRNRLGSGTVSQIFLSKKKTHEENE